MKKLAVRSLGWGLGIIAFAQIPVFASNPAQNTMPSQPQATQPSELLAVALTSRSLRLGDSGSDVRALQRFLSRNGLYSYEIDGVYGQETAESVAVYQRIRDLPATGIADEATLKDMDFDFLPVAAAPTPTPTSRPPAATGSLGAGSLASGAVGTDVIALQQRLNAYGIPVFVDGVYGFETEQGVRTYQRVQGLTVSGVADSETLENMGFSVESYPYIAAVIADPSELAALQELFQTPGNAVFIDSDRRGKFINIGSFAERFPAEARVDAAAARGYESRVLYQRN